MHNMQYPLISEYVKAIQYAGDNLEQLAHLTPVLDDNTMSLNEKYYYCGMGMLLCLFAGFIQSVFYA